jgi:ribosomal protein S18 acetylase RimI-like enzyme
VVATLNSRGDSPRLSDTVSLRPLTSAECDRFVELHVPAFAAAKVASGDWPADVALDEARQAFARALPQGIASPGHELYALVAEDTQVGWLWLELRRDSLVPYAYIYELSIDEPFRRQGLGRQAISLAAARCRELGLSRLVLHVFAANRGAIALYEECGFTMTDHWMALAIEPQAGPTARPAPYPAT